MSKMVFNGATVQNKSATANRWKQVNPVLAKGELGHESDTGKLKCGDGVAAWNKLPYVGNTAEGMPLIYDGPKSVKLAENMDGSNPIEVGIIGHESIGASWAAGIKFPLYETDKMTGLNYGYVNGKSYSGTALRAKLDVHGNSIIDTYARKDEIPKVPDMGEYVKKRDIALGVRVRSEAVAFGLGSQAGWGVAIGSNAVTEADGVSIGSNAVTEADGVSIGSNAVTEADGVSIGSCSEAYDKGVSLGEHAAADGTNVALGSSSMAFTDSPTDCIVSVGNDEDSFYRRITSVAPAVLDCDAVTLQQLKEVHKAFELLGEYFKNLGFFNPNQGGYAYKKIYGDPGGKDAPEWVKKCVPTAI